MMEQKLKSEIGSKNQETSQVNEENTFLGTSELQIDNRMSSNANNEVEVSSEIPIIKDFKQTPKYNDTESYASQHHHSIGTGLYLTDEINDLPPRFKQKVIKALEAGAAVNNIPLDKIPMAGFMYDSDKEDDQFDSLIITSTSAGNEKKRRSEINPASCVNSSSHKKNYSSNSNVAASNIQCGKISSIADNLKPPISNDTKRSKSHFKLDPHMSAHKNYKDINSHSDKNKYQSDIRNKSQFVQKPYSSQTDSHSDIEQSHFKYPPKYVNNSVHQRNHSCRETLKFESSNEFEHQSKKNTPEYHKDYIDKRLDNKYLQNSSNCVAKRESCKMQNFSQKEQKRHYDDFDQYSNCFDEFHPGSESFHSVKSSKPSGNNASSMNFSGKIPSHNRGKYHGHNRSVSTSSQSSLTSSCDKDLSNETIKPQSKQTFFESKRNFGKFPRKLKTAFFNEIGDHNHKKTESSSSHSSSFLDHDKNVSNERHTDFNKSSFPGKYSTSEISKDNVNIDYSNEVKGHNHPRTTTSSHSSSTSYCKKVTSKGKREGQDSFNETHKNLENSTDSINTCNSIDRFSYKKPAYKYREEKSNFSHKMQHNFVPEKDFGDSSNPSGTQNFSDMSGCEKINQNISSVVGKNEYLNNNSHCDSSCKYSVQVNKGNTFKKKSDFKKRSDDAKSDFDIVSIESSNNVSHHYDEKKNSQQPNYRGRKSKPDFEPTSRFEKSQDFSNDDVKLNKSNKFQKYSDFDRTCNDSESDFDVASIGSSNRASHHSEEKRNSQQFNYRGKKSKPDLGPTNSRFEESQDFSNDGVKLNKSNKFQKNDFDRTSNDSRRDFDVTSRGSSNRVSRYSGQNKNSQQSNYIEKKNKPNFRPTNRFERSRDLSNDSMNSLSSDRNLNIASANESRKQRGCCEPGFFLKIEVSEEARNLEYWLKILKSVLSFPFELERCCHFSDILILQFDRREQQFKASKILLAQKKEMKNSKMPYITDISTLLTHLFKPCTCRQKVIEDCKKSIEKYATVSLNIVAEKMQEIENLIFKIRKSKFAKHNLTSKLDTLQPLEESMSNFKSIKTNILREVEAAENLKTVQKLKFSFIRECNAFKRCLPIYSKKRTIMDSVRYKSVSVIIAETGSGKSTQLVEYLLHSDISNYGLIICTQPRKVAAISIAQYVSGQIGSAVGKIVGYEAGVECKCSELTKIIYMTDYCLLKKFLRNPNLKDISCIIIDEAHERSLYTDLLLGMLKSCISKRPDLRIIITSATINPAIFVNYFKLSPENVIEVPGRSYPVDVVWWPEDVEKGWNYIDACVHKVYEIYKKYGDGDILVFLTSSNDSEEAIDLFKKLLSNKDKMPRLLSLHGKSDIKEQMQVFEIMPQTIRKIVFATNVAETSVTIPGIKYVVDSGMTKDLKFDPKMNKNYLEVTFINKSAAEQRKGRAGRTQSGVCFRMYSKRNFAENMEDNAIAEIMKINLQKALLKIFELGINPRNFDFIETPPERTISNSIDSLEYLKAIENDKLTELGRKIAKLPVEPQLGKLILQGIDAGIGYEIVIIAALVTESSKLFLRSEERSLADEKRKKFYQVGGDLCTYLEIYKRWKEIEFQDRYKWCVNNYIRSKSLFSAAKVIYEIIMSLKIDLGLRIPTRYNYNGFKKQYEKIFFDCFSENLCVSSGHPKLGYLSPYLAESFFIHPSSTVSFFGKDKPEFLVYRTLMETSRNFLFDITPISEETIKSANQQGSFNLPLHSLKCLQVPPKIMGPFGESVLVRYVLGKQGSRIKDLEMKIQQKVKVKNIHIDVAVDKGLITIYLPQRFHERISTDINQIIEEAHNEMLKEEDMVKLSGTSMYFALGAGGFINDIIMPGEYRELILSNIKIGKINDIKKALAEFGPIQSISQSLSNENYEIFVTYKKVCDAERAFSELKNEKSFEISSKSYLPNECESSAPLNILTISWCRCPCNGKGTVELFSAEDLINASNILSCKSFTIDDKLLMFTPSPYSSKELKIMNLPETADVQRIRNKMQECLPEDIKIRNITILRKQCKSDAKDAKLKLSKLLHQYMPCTKFEIHMNPKNEEIWTASVYFESPGDVDKAFMKLENKTQLDSYPLFVKRIYKSSMHCKKEVYRVTSKKVHDILEEKKKKGLCEEFSVKKFSNKYDFSVEFSCISVQELNKIRQKLRYFLLGETINFIGTSKYDFLFSDFHNELIKTVQISTNTWIELFKSKKTITIYGSVEDCQKAKEKIYSLSLNPDLSYTRTFNLRDSHIPVGFLKELYSKYGFNLQGLANEFKVTYASVDNFGKTLVLKGMKNAIKKAEQRLEEMCAKLFESKGERQKTSSQQEICPICFDPVPYDFQRLELCGHAFCRPCLLLQIESKTLPVVCVKENCEKQIFLEDIKRIISLGGDHLKKDFCSAALQHHVSINGGKISYCPTPDCQMIYRTTKDEMEFKCPSCKNSTCTHCHALYHYGMSCEMFKNCQEDEDYSLKTWIKENESTRKYCPSCKAVIEKESGCNHMECLNCKAHMCWLCLKIFPTGDDVYKHLPYCPKNQSI